MKWWLWLASLTAVACRTRGDVAFEVPDAPAPVVSAATAPPRGPIPGPLGTTHPLRVEAHAPSGHWVVIAQARRDTDGDGRVFTRMDGETISGDALASYFIDEPGTGIAIDAFGGASDDGRWVVLARDGHWRLRDTFSGHDARLGAFDDLAPAFRFDAASRRMAYVSRSATLTELRIRALGDDTEHRVELPPGTLETLALDPTGTVAVAAVREGDAGSAMYVVQQGAAAATNVEGHVVWLHAGRAITRADDNALVDAVTNAIVVPRTCGADVLAVSESSKRVWVACRRDRRTARDDYGEYETFALAWFAVDGTSETLEARVRLDALFEPGAALIRTSDDRFVDPDTGTIGKALCAPAVARVGDRIFCIEEEAFVYDLAAGEPRTVSKAAFIVAEAIAQQGRFLATPLESRSGLVVDMEQGLALGTVTGPVLGLTDSGMALVPEHDTGEFTGFVRGPVSWVEPSGDDRPPGDSRGPLALRNNVGLHLGTEPPLRQPRPGCRGSAPPL